MTLLSQSVATHGLKPKDFFPIRSLFSPHFFICTVVFCTILLSWTTVLFPSIPFMATALNARNEVRPLSPEGGQHTRGERGDQSLPPLLYTIPEIIRVTGCAMETHSLPNDRLDQTPSTDSLSVSSSAALRCVVPRMSTEEHPSSAMPLPALTLSIRGRHLPFSSPSYVEGEWRIELQESESSVGVESPVPLDGETHTADTSSFPSSRSSFSSLRRLSCASIVPSTLFPTELFTCTIPSLPPSFFSPVGSTRTSSTGTAATTGSSVWMDAFLVRRRSSAASPIQKERLEREEEANEENEEKEGEAWKVVAVRRAAVELIHADRTEDKRTSRASQHDQRHTVEKQEEKEEGASEEREAESGNFSALHATSPLERLEEVYRGGDRIWAELGVGGLHATLHTLLRRVFLSRFPSLHSVVHSLSLEPVRGVILHGPTGTGKTLIARTLIDVLGPTAHVSIVHSTDILSKFVGESEQKLEQLFTQTMAAPWEVEDEEEEEEEEEVVGTSGEASPHSSSTASTMPNHHRNNKRKKNDVDHAYFPHVIIIDELETLFVRRNGNRDGSSAGWLYESVTNTLLSLMDGLNTQRSLHPSGSATPSRYHNVLVIGITNRVEVLDPALLRPGRFEVVLEIPSPDREALEEIFMIHTAALQQHGFLDPDVVSSEMSDRMFGFTGAEVAGVTRAAISAAMESHVREAHARTHWNHSNRQDENVPFRVRREHFVKSIAEIRHSTARQEDPYHCWGPPLSPSFSSSVSSFSAASSSPLAGGGLPMRPSPHTTAATLPVSIVDYSGHLWSRLEAVVDFWYSLHPFSALSASSVVADHRQDEGSTTVAGRSPSPIMEDERFLSFPSTGSAGVVAVEGARGNGKTTVLRYLHDRFRRAARLATAPSLSSSSLFHSRYLDGQSVLAWSKHASLDEMASRVEEWLKRAENLLRDGLDEFGTASTTTTTTPSSPPSPRHVVVMIDGLDHLLAALRPYPTLEASVRNAMYRFVTSCRQGVSLSSYPTSHLLLLTSSHSITSLLPDLMPDMIVTLPLLSRLDLQKRVLHSFLITPTKEEEEEEEERRRKSNDVQRVLLPDGDAKKETEKPSTGSGVAPPPAASSRSANSPTASSSISALVARSYPSSMTFTTFLQLTEKALRQSITKPVVKRVDRTTAEDTEGSSPRSSPSLSSSSDASQKVEAPRSATSIRWPRYGAPVASFPSNGQGTEENASHNTTANDEAVVAIRGRDAAAIFAQEVLSVSAEMGLLYR